MKSRFLALLFAGLAGAAGFCESRSESDRSNADWPMLAHDPARSGATPIELRPPFDRKWYRLFPDEGLIAGIQPVVTDGKVFVGTMAGVLHAMDVETGKDVWTYKAGGAILHTCAAAGGKVFFGAADGKIYGVHAKDGSFAWAAQTGAAVWNSPVVFDGLVIAGSRDSKLYACDAATGAVRWTAPTGGPILNSPAVDPQRRLVYVGSEDMHVYAFNLDSGRTLWKSPKLPGVSFRAYHPVIAPDGTVLVTVMPCAGADAIMPVLLDMVKEVFGDFASWRHNKEENDKLRKMNFEQLAKPETYPRQMDYLRKRLADVPAMQTFFALDPQTGRQKFVAPIVYGESMNGPGEPARVAPDGKVIVKYQALLRSRYEHYSPFLNVGYLDTKTGDITAIMDQSRTYGWHDSLLLVHDEQCALTVGGRVLFNTHQDNVNAMDLDTLKGYAEPMCRGVHEVKPGTALAIWARILRDEPLPVGWEWIARGTAVYGGGSVMDVPISIAGDSFYYLPTHEINAGCAVVAYRMQAGGKAAQKSAEPSEKLTDEEWKKICAMKWDWDLLKMPRLKVTLDGMEPRVAALPLFSASAQNAAPADADLDKIIWEIAKPAASGRKQNEILRGQLTDAVTELISRNWRPLLFPAGKHPVEAYRFFVEPTETLCTLALAYPHLPEALQQHVKARVAELSAEGKPLGGLTGRSVYDPNIGDMRSLYDPAPEKMLRIQDDLVRSDLARLYPLWLWAGTTGDWARLERDWPKLRDLFNSPPSKTEPDFGNARIAGLIATCRIAKHLDDRDFVDKALPAVRKAMRERLEYEWAHPEDGVIVSVPHLRTIFGRWRNLTPEVGRLLREQTGRIHRRLMDVYVDHHRPLWWMAWTFEHMWRNETPLAFPTAAMEIFSARALILDEPSDKLARFLDLPWCKGDEFYIQKLALVLNAE
ncbi:MAG: PQQ-binding-like beta-propeller repeat protein [Candidatus Sumerlaeia bacterium]|nr:PQQ-binding-like beta-propeller repeat protein [Candidatus Sumerlaeia bacterium]